MKRVKLRNSHNARDWRTRYAKIRFEIEYDLEELQRQEVMLAKAHEGVAFGRRLFAFFSRCARNNLIIPGGPLPIKSEPSEAALFWVGVNFISASQSRACVGHGRWSNFISASQSVATIVISANSDHSRPNHSGCVVSVVHPRSEP